MGAEEGAAEEMGRSEEEVEGHSGAWAEEDRRAAVPTARGS